MGMDVRFALKNSPEMLSCSQRTTTIFWPLSSCFATVLARRPRRWPLPSMTIYIKSSVSACVRTPASAANIHLLRECFRECVPPARRSTLCPGVVCRLGTDGRRCRR